MGFAPKFENSGQGDSRESSHSSWNPTKTNTVANATMNNAYRRRRLTVLLCLVGLLLLSRQQNNATERIYRRSCRRLIRNCGWWDLVWNSYSDERFKKTFRVSKNTFNFILSRVRHDLERETINEDPISPECQLAICLYHIIIIMIIIIT